MMQAIRTRAGSIVVKVLFGLLIISFGFWGLYTRSDYFQERSPGTVIATVGGKDIRAEQLQQELEPAIERLRAQFGGTLDAQQIKQLGIADSLLKQLIDRGLLDQESTRLGLEASDEVVRSTIYDNPAFRGADGKFDRALFSQILMMNHLTEDQLVARLRNDIPRADLLQSVTTGITAPQPVVEALYRYRNEKRLADIVSFPVAAVTDIGQPGDADLTKFYEAHPDLFRAPEYRTVTIASLSPTDLKQGDVPDDKLRAEYDQHKDDFGTPERRDIQQILALSEEKAKEGEAALAAGKDWKDVAASMGQDSDSVELGSLSRQEIPHELGDVAFDLSLDKPSDPVKSPMGWHILRVTKIDPATTQSFEEAKAKIQADMKLQDAVDRLDKIGNQADDALAGGSTLADVAAKFGLKTMTIAAIDDSGKDPEGKPVLLPVAGDELLKTVFATNPGDTSRVADTQDGAIYAVRVDKVTPPQVKPLADVKDQAVAAWQAEQKRDSTTKQAEALAGAVGGEMPLAKVAGDKNLTLLAAVPLSRAQTQSQPVPAALIGKLFAAKIGDVMTASDPNGAYVAQLKEIQTPETIPAEGATGLTDKLAEETKDDVAGQFTEALRKRFPVEIKRDALDKMF